MTFRLRFTSAAKEQYDRLPAAKLGKVKRALGFLQSNPRHPSLDTHLYSGYQNPFHSAEPVFEAYAENRTPATVFSGAMAPSKPNSRLPRLHHTRRNSFQLLFA
jgi:hypothetical protein